MGIRTGYYIYFNRNPAYISLRPDNAVIDIELFLFCNVMIRIHQFLQVIRVY